MPSSHPSEQAPYAPATNCGHAKALQSASSLGLAPPHSSAATFWLVSDLLTHETVRFLNPTPQSLVHVVHNPDFQTPRQTSPMQALHTLSWHF